MGIRVNKVLGYGLTDATKKIEAEDLPIDEAQEIDPINWESPLLKYDEEAMSLDNYLAWLEVNTDEYNIELVMLRKQLEQYDHFKANTNYTRLSVKDPRWKHEPVNAISRGDADGGLSNVLCITPVWQLDSWHRWDDAIDWVEESYFPKPGHKEQTSYVKVVEDGIFPYSSLWMHAQTGESLPGDNVRNWVRMKNYYNKYPEKFDGEATKLELDIYASHAGFIDHEDALANCVPYVPEEIRNLAEFGELFTTDDAWMNLRPMLYVYWR